jgi:nitronate monooxygenase
MGASGVLMGTRFKASAEFAGSEAHKAAIVSSDGSDTTADAVTDAAYPFEWPAGVVGRALRTEFISAWEGRADELRAKARSYDHPFGILIDSSVSPAVDVNWGGESAALVEEVLSAATVVERTVAEAEALLRNVTALLT